MSKPVLTFPFYAVIQDGYCIFGIGKTAAAAWEDAREWMEEWDKSYKEWMDNRKFRTPGGVFGSIDCVPCTAAVANAVQKHGGNIIWVDVDGGIGLPEENE